MKISVHILRDSALQGFVVVKLELFMDNISNLIWKTPFGSVE